MKIKVHKRICDITLKPYVVIEVKIGIIEAIFNSARTSTFYSKLYHMNFRYYTNPRLNHVNRDVNMEDVSSVIKSVNDVYAAVCEAYKNL